MLIKRLHAIHAVINNQKRQIYNMYLLDTIPIKYCSTCSCETGETHIKHRCQLKYTRFITQIYVNVVLKLWTSGWIKRTMVQRTIIMSITRRHFEFDSTNTVILTKNYFWPSKFMEKHFQSGSKDKLRFREVTISIAPHFHVLRVGQGMKMS